MKFSGGAEANSRREAKHSSSRVNPGGTPRTNPGCRVDNARVWGRRERFQRHLGFKLRRVT